MTNDVMSNEMLAIKLPLPAVVDDTPIVVDDAPVVVGGVTVVSSGIVADKITAS